jgi:phosphatidylserine/phosphatidylglycerophosphate/cardiolipin synthase-like enzyme
MNAADAERFLSATLADGRLTGGEKQDLAAWLAEHAPTDPLRGVVRHAAFDLARKAHPDAAAVLDWLEGVMRAVAPVHGKTPAADAPGSPAAVAFAPGEGCLSLIVRRLAAARRSLDLCVFTITDDRIGRPILDAHRRGVMVRIVTDNDKAHDPGSDVFRFRDAGIPVKFDPAGRPSDPHTTGHMHHKFAVIDGSRLLNGSYNWTRGAAEVNYENVVDTTEPGLVAAFAAEFDRLWAAF